jgi:subtilisin family serine protease
MDHLGVLEEKIGEILQRGGEELALTKVSDRFTICFSSPPQRLPESIPFLEHDPIVYRSPSQASLHLEQMIVEKDHLDLAMDLSRTEDGVIFASHVYQLKNSPKTYIYLTNQITIQFDTQTSTEQQQAIAAQYALELQEPVKGLTATFVYQLTPKSLENPLKITNRLIENPSVLLAEPNVIFRQEPLYIPKDPFYRRQWYLNHKGGYHLSLNSHINVEPAWDITKGKRSVIVAIADDAIDINHPDFQGKNKIVAPRDFKDQDFSPLPEHSSESHGTACAGLALAEENGTGIVGVAPGCALMPLRTTGFLDDQALEDLFNWAIDKGASIISCSWAASAVRFPLSLRQQAIINRAATEGRQGKGCIILFAAGNANRPLNGTLYERPWSKLPIKGPIHWLNGFAVHPDVITVSACTSLNKKAAYSNWGANISVCAPSSNAAPMMWFEEIGMVKTAPEITVSLPGLKVFSTDQLGKLGYEAGNFTDSFGGTSSACPLVAGIAALMLSINPHLTAQEVKQILQETADKIIDTDPDPQLGLELGTYDQTGHSQWFGYGKVNAFKAVKAAQQRLVLNVANLNSGSSITTIFQPNNTTLEIPDNNPQGVSSPIEIKEAKNIASISVRVEIDHEFLGDLEIALKTPTGQVILLQNRTLGCQTQLRNIYSSENTPNLKQLFNHSTEGIWWLWVVDYAQEDTGILKNWELVFEL